MDLWRALAADRLGEPRYVRYQPERRLIVLSRERLDDYRRSASSVITAS